MEVNTEVNNNFKRIISSERSDYYYMDVTLEVFGEGPMPDTAETLKVMIINGMKNIFGEVGAATSIDILKFKPDESHAILRVPGNEFRKVWSSLSLISNFMGTNCCIRVNKVSPFLMSLSASSRTFEHS